MGDKNKLKKASPDFNRASILVFYLGSFEVFAVGTGPIWFVLGPAFATGIRFVIVGIRCIDKDHLHCDDLSLIIPGHIQRVHTVTPATGANYT